MIGLDELRKLYVYADGTRIAEDCRVRVRGRSTMSLIPDIWEIDLFNITPESMAYLKTSERITARGEDDSALVYGEIDEVYTHAEEANDVTTVVVTDGASFWESVISLSIASGNEIESTIRAIVSRCSSPIQIVSFRARSTKLLRGQTFMGRAAEYVRILSRSIGARAYIVKNALGIVQKGASTTVVDITDDDLPEGVSEANGAFVLRMEKMIGYPVGQLMTINGSTTKYRIVVQSVDLDNFGGSWRNELIVVDEGKILDGEWGGG